MRIAVLHNHPIHYKHLLFTAIAALGVEVDAVFVASSSIARTPSMQPAGESYRSHFLSEGSFEDAPQFRTALRAVNVMGRCNPDVVVISGYSYLAAWFVLLWARILRKPAVLWFESNHFDHPRRAAKESIKKLFIRGCDAGHVYGRSNRDYLERLGMASAAILEKRATVDSGIFMQRRAQFHAGLRRFIYVGRFSPEKNLLTLLGAFQTVVGHHPAELLMVGYGPEEALLKGQVRELGLDGSVSFYGPATQEEVACFLAEADCLVLPSWSETWGLVVNEALCTGIPVIVSNRCGCAQDLVNEDTGWIVPAEDTLELARAMEEVCGLTLERLRTMSESAVKIAVEYTPQRCAERIVTNLDELLIEDGIRRTGHRS